MLPNNLCSLAQAASPDTQLSGSFWALSVRSDLGLHSFTTMNKFSICSHSVRELRRSKSPELPELQGVIQGPMALKSTGEPPLLLV
jgi:hypothetical protein